jgi:hypothetical protein
MGRELRSEVRGTWDQRKISRANHMTSLNRATEDKLVRSDEYHRIGNAIKARNDAVHRQVRVAMSDSKMYVASILRVVARLQGDAGPDQDTSTSA